MHESLLQKSSQKTFRMRHQKSPLQKFIKCTYIQITSIYFNFGLVFANYVQITSITACNVIKPTKINNQKYAFL